MEKKPPQKKPKDGSSWQVGSENIVVMYIISKWKIVIDFSQENILQMTSKGRTKTEYNHHFEQQ